MGTDGSLGLKAIKGELGMAMVQEPDSAKYDGMPPAPIDTGLADFVLPPDKMAEAAHRLHPAPQKKPVARKL